jgi:hypothetical protein
VAAEGPAGPYAVMILGALRPFLPMVAAVAGEFLTTDDLDKVERHLAAVETLGSTVLESSGAGEEAALDPLGPGGAPQPVFGAALRAFRGLILELAPSRVFPGLDAFPAPSGEVVWVCARHAAIYRPEPVQLP